MLIFKRLLEYGFSKYWNRRFLTFPWPSWPCRQKCSRVTTPHPPRIHCRDVKQQLYAKKSFVQLKTRLTPKSGFCSWTIIHDVFYVSLHKSTCISFHILNKEAGLFGLRNYAGICLVEAYRSTKFFTVIHHLECKSHFVPLCNHCVSVSSFCSFSWQSLS